MSNRCASCGSEASGNFCSRCGASLTTVLSCSACGNEIPPGGRFCNMCGLAARKGVDVPTGTVADPLPASLSAMSPAESRARQSRRGLPWLLMGAAFLVLAVVFVVRMEPESLAPPAQPSPPPANAPAAGGAAGVDLSSMTPREAADRLFNRVMQAAATGDTAQARAFAPMALAAYDLVDDPDIDVHYHLALIHLANGNATAARIEADAILTQIPTHLFGLLTAAQSARLAGNTVEARTLYQQLLDNYQAEMASGRQEYFEHHAPALEPMRAEASDYLSGVN